MMAPALRLPLSDSAALDRARLIVLLLVGCLLLPNAPGWPTPRGEFYIRNKLSHYQSAAYGPVAFGTSAHSTRATDWPAGGYVGIHGTDQPDLIPGRISHGCIRMRNRDILAMARVLSVGTPVTIR